MVESCGSPTPMHTILILLIVLTILGVPMLLPEGDGEMLSLLPEWASLNPVLMLCPLLLLLLVRYLGSSDVCCVKADAGSIHRISGSSTGLVLLLLLVISLISFRSLLQDSLMGADGE